MFTYTQRTLKLFLQPELFHKHQNHIFIHLHWVSQICLNSTCPGLDYLVSCLFSVFPNPRIGIAAYTISHLEFRNLVLFCLGKFSLFRLRLISSHYAAWNGFYFLVLPSQPSECWDYKHVPLCLALGSNF
jgi:hypothetical protein